LPILIISFSILLGIIIITKIILTMKYGHLKERNTKNIIENFLLFLGAIFLMWFPLSYNGEDTQLIKLKKNINIVTYILYGLVIIFGIIIFIQIYDIRNGT